MNGKIALAGHPTDRALPESAIVYHTRTQFIVTHRMVQC
jgi:hypothetical protein